MKPLSLLLTVFVSAVTPLFAVTPQEELDTQVPAARAILDKWQADQPEKGERAIHLVYWTPSYREPAPRYRERLSKIMEEVRGFYAREMERNGFGRRTINLVHEPDGLCKIHLVRGAAPYAQYQVDSGAEIRAECSPVLKKAGVIPDKETIVIFCNMSNWDPEKGTMSQNSPYYAGGSSWSGTAWQVDSPLLDLDLLAKREPMIRDGQYGKISVGRYNSIFIGGIIHEIGHALSMPHNRARPDQAAMWGTALMGDGNRTYGEELRGEGKGTFLTLGEAMRLASHPMFCGSVKGFRGKANAKLEDLKLTPNGKSFGLSARVTANPPVYGVIGYTDPAGGGDYDATTYTAVPDAEGRFSFECNALTAGKAGVLHLVMLQSNGAKNTDVGSTGEPMLPYFVNADGTVDLSASLAREKLAEVIKAVNGSHAAASEAQAALEKLESGKVEPQILEVARELVATLNPSNRGVSPVEAKGDNLSLSSAATVEASVGWGRPTSNRLPGENPIITSGSRIFAKGIYAHAPAQHAWELGGTWKRLTGKAGMAEGHEGSVVFTITADGQQLWKSRLIRAGQTVSYDVPVTDAKRLELNVSDGGDGNGSDWGLWLEPTLTR